jgi:hypothetical protein
MRYPLIEGFDYYAAASGAGGISSRWNVPVTGAMTLITPGLGGEGKGLAFESAFTGRLEFGFEEVSKITLHFAIQVTTRDGAGIGDFMSMQTQLGNHQWSLFMNAAGFIQLKGENNAILATSSAPLITNQTARICLSADLSGTGKFRMSIDGVDDPNMHLDGVDIQDDATNVMGLLVFATMHSATGGNIKHRIDDVILGIDECVDWGPMEVNTLGPTADVAVAFTPSTGVSNFGNVDETAFDADSTYNSSVTVGQKDCFEFEDSPHVPDKILAVQLLSVARKEESAVRKLREFLRLGGIDYNGTEHNLQETYGHWPSVWVLNPATGVDFTPADINAIRGGYELTEVD